MTLPILRLTVLPGRYSIYCLKPDAIVPDGLLSEGIASITRTERELTIVSEEGRIDSYEKRDEGWRCLKVDGSFNLEATGVIAAIAGPLAEIGVSIYVVSTFDTDYVLLKEERLVESVQRLSSLGHEVEAAAE